MSSRRTHLIGGVRILRSALADVIVQDILGVNPSPELIESNRFRIENRLDAVGVFSDEENPLPSKMPRSISDSYEEPSRCKRARIDHSDSTNSEDM